MLVMKKLSTYRHTTSKKKTTDLPSYKYQTKLLISMYESITFSFNRVDFVLRCLQELCSHCKNYQSRVIPIAKIH